MINENPNILGCFVSGPSLLSDASAEDKEIASQTGELFRSYIWGKKGICDTLKKLKHSDYGDDIFLILLQFYINPIPYLRKNLKEIENYRKKEKAIGIPIIVTDENFFNLSEEDRYNFLKHTVFQKLELVSEVVKKKKLDTNINLLIADLSKIL
jgi:hypothetical protein